MNGHLYIINLLMFYCTRTLYSLMEHLNLAILVYEIHCHNPNLFIQVVAIHLLIDVLCIFSVLSLDPVIGAIAAGNTVVVKPSEISSATSSVLSNLLEECVDKSAIRVVEGSVAETSALLEQQWDKIFFTGFALYPFSVMISQIRYLFLVFLKQFSK